MVSTAPPGMVLPPGGPTPAWVSEVADTLRSARSELARRTAADIIASLGAAGERFLDPADALRREALERLPVTSGLSPAMCAAVLDGMAADWTAHRLGALVSAELGGPAALDDFVRVGLTATMAVGPALAVQIVAGSVPGVGVTALIRSLLVKGPTLLKPGRGDGVLPALFARALDDVDRPLARALAVVYWPGGSRAHENAALARADVVTVYGSDATVRDVRARTPVTARLVEYRHRISVGLVGREALASGQVETVAAEVSASVALFDQRGCVSPHIVWVEERGDRSPAAFAELLAAALDGLERRWPTGALDLAEASTLQQARGTAELLATAGGGMVRHGAAAPWTVVYEAAVGLTDASPLRPAGRWVRVRSLADAMDLPGLLMPLDPHLQTVGVAGLGARLEEVARALGAVGVSRVAPFAAVGFPPPWWHHDGRGPLLDLVRWVDLEGASEATPRRSAPGGCR